MEMWWCSIEVHTSVQNPTANRLIDDDVIMILDPISGEILATWGGGNKFSKPHGIEITEEGNIFITDVTLHQVIKFDYDSETELWQNDASLVLGEKFVPGSDTSHFCRPADVAVLPSTKEIFVADGYCGFRIVKFNQYGQYLSEFGAGTSNPLTPPIPFNVTHALTVAEPEDTNDLRRPMVFVADRDNGRIQSFDVNGTFLYEIEQNYFFTTDNEMVTSLAFVPRTIDNACSSDTDEEKPYGTLYVVNGHLPLGQAKLFQFSVFRSHFRLVRSLKISSRSEEITPRREIPHCISVSKDGEMLFIIEAFGNLTVKKFTKRPYSTSSNAAHCNLLLTDGHSVYFMAFIHFITLIELF